MIVSQRWNRIKVKAWLSVFILILVSCYLAFFHFYTAPEKVITLTAGDFEHIRFSSKKPSLYSYQDNKLLIEVDNSASFLMQAFDKVKPVDKVAFEWRSQGAPAITDAAHEARRDGDDAVFKLGLLLASDSSPDDIFLPSWMRRVKELLHFDSEQMMFLVAGAKHPAGQHWQGPYNSRMTMISMISVTDQQGWNKAVYEFEEPVEVVAMWLMADGDDTHSTFITEIKNIVIKESAGLAE
jgi:hypothetical protein